MATSSKGGIYIYIYTLYIISLYDCLFCVFIYTAALKIKLKLVVSSTCEITLSVVSTATDRHYRHILPSDPTKERHSWQPLPGRHASHFQCEALRW